MWRGTPLSNVESAVLQREAVPALTERYLTACEQWAVVRLRLGRPGAVAGKLGPLAAAHPFRETLVGQAEATLEDTAWRTSTRSGNGGACVQAAPLDDTAWHTSTHSNNGGDCVQAASLGETAWRVSTRSGNGGECVQIADVRRVVTVRDSKDPRGPHLDFGPDAWRGFLTTLKG